ncbi:uncharacterized protein LOC107269164 isoform X3 [Cephus cinctus]|nr:uncharacterized protein LOC107269164 isoform X3 [Cephus cinctus]
MSSSNKSVDEVINDALLEKLCSFALKPQENDDTIKSILLKIMTRVTSSDRYTRERALEKLWRKNFSNAETFVTLLEMRLTAVIILIALIWLLESFQKGEALIGYDCRSNQPNVTTISLLEIGNCDIPPPQV